MHLWVWKPCSVIINISIKINFNFWFRIFWLLSGTWWSVFSHISWDIFCDISSKIKFSEKLWLKNAVSMRNWIFLHALYCKIQLNQAQNTKIFAHYLNEVKFWKCHQHFRNGFSWVPTTNQGKLALLKIDFIQIISEDFCVLCLIQISQ